MTGKIKTFLLLSLALSLTLGLTACMRQAALQNPANLPVMSASGKALKPAQVRQAILDACREKGWIARELTPGVISASLAVRAHNAEVEIPYSGTNYSILYKHSSNLDYNAADRTIHNQYNNWVDYLRRSIDARIAEMK